MNDLVMSLVGFVVVLVVVLVSMILHELMHGLVAYWLGDDTARLEGRLSLNPVKHIDPFYSLILPLLLYVLGGPVFGGAKPVPVNSDKIKGREWGMALVAIAGPLTNLLIAFLAFLIYFVLFKNGVANSFLNMILYYFISVNLGFAVFNILPIPPLDGSRIIYAIAPDGIRGLLRRIEAFGVWVVYAMILLFGSVFSGIMTDAINGIYDFFCWIVGL